MAIVAARAVAAQSSLADALAVADRHAFANRIAASSARSAAAEELAPYKGILPSVRIEAGYLRTTDPIGAFGSTLRQRSITQADFAPDRLNYPSAVGNYQSGVVVEQPLVNADAWMGRQAASRAADASRAAEEWTRLSTRADVTRNWYGVILASERVTTLTAAARAAHAHVAQAEAMVRQGIVTRSDALLASVRAGDVDAQLLEATADEAKARRHLAIVLGHTTVPGEIAGPTSGATLPSAERIRAVVASDTVDVPGAPRADVRAADRAVSAADADAVRARSVLLPRLNAFARYDWNSATHLYQGDKNWTVGLIASWSLFAGASDIAEVRGTASREQSARAGAEATRARATAELDDTREALAVALARLTITEQSVRQSAEAHRIVARKYDGGLATVVELLDAQAVETASALALANARYATIAAAAARRQALGRDPGTLTALDDTSVLAGNTIESPVANSNPR